MMSKGPLQPELSYDYTSMEKMQHIANAFWQSHHLRADFLKSEKTDMSSQLSLKLNRFLASRFPEEWKLLLVR